jgi:hypothetical protein
VFRLHGTFTYVSVTRRRTGHVNGAVSVRALDSTDRRGYIPGVDLNQETVLRPVSVELPKTLTLLESPRSDRITLQQKQIILEYYQAKGNMTEACAAAGLAPRSFRQIRAVDTELDAAVTEIEREFVERAKGYMLTHMARPGNYMDRVTIARRFEPGVWGDTPRLQVDVNVTHVDGALQRAKAIEAELEPPPLSNSAPPTLKEST